MRYTWLSGLVLSGLPAIASAGHADLRVHVGLPVPGISFGFGHHHHGFVGPAFVGGFCAPSIYIGPSYDYAPPVVYTAPAPVTYQAPVPAATTYEAPAPAATVYTTPPTVVYAAPVPAPVYYGPSVYVGGPFYGPRIYVGSRYYHYHRR